MSFISTLGEQTAGAVLGAGMGIATASWQDKRQRDQQRRLNKIQLEAQKDMGEFNYQKQMDLWNNTNYGAQMAHLKKAGLNPALIYGQGGAGGATAAAQAGSVGGASAAGGSGEVGQMMGIAMQRELLKAQKENIEADTKNKLVDAENKGEGGADRENTLADTAIKKIQADIQELDLDMANDSYKARLARIKNEASESLHNMNIAEKEDWISENTWNTKIKQVEAELIGLGIKNELARAQTDKTWSDIKVNNAQIQNWLEQNAQGWLKLDQDAQRIAIEKLLQEFNTSLSREALGALGGVISTVIGKGMTKGTKIEKKTINLPQGTKGFGGE